MAFLIMQTLERLLDPTPYKDKYRVALYAMELMSSFDKAVPCETLFVDLRPARRHSYMYEDWYYDPFEKSRANNEKVLCLRGGISVVHNSSRMILLVDVLFPRAFPNHSPAVYPRCPDHVDENGVRFIYVPEELTGVDIIERQRIKCRNTSNTNILKLISATTFIESEIENAVQDSRLDVVRELLGKGYSADELNAALLAAVECGDLEIVRFLLGKGAHLNQLSNNERKECCIWQLLTGFKKPVWHGHVILVMDVLAAGLDEASTDVSAAVQKRLACIMKEAVMAYDGAPVVSMLLEAGASVDAECIADARNYDVVLLLLDAGGDVNPWKTGLRERNSSQYYEVDWYSKLLLEAGGNAHDLVIHGPYALHKVEDVVFAEMLVGAGAEVLGSVVDEEGNRCDGPLFHDNLHSDKVFEVFAKAAMNIHDTNSTGQTALHFWAEKLHIRRITILLEAGASIAEKDGDGNNLLHIAIAKDLSLVKFLVERSSVAAIQEATEGVNMNGETPLHIAAAHSCDESFDFMYSLSTRAAIALRNSQGQTALDIVVGKEYIHRIQRLIDAGANDEEDETPAGSLRLHEAVVQGWTDMVSELIVDGVSVGQKDKDGNTALHLAALLGRLTILTLLLNASPESIEETNNDGQTALYMAVDRKHSSIVELLLEAGATVNTKPGNLPILLVAMLADAKECATHLIARGAVMHTEANILHLATKLSKIWFLDIILGVPSVRVDETDSKGKTTLHYAAMYNVAGAVEPLVRAGANVNQRDHHGDTALHMAVRSGSSDAVVSALIAVGADVNARDRDGCTPLHRAALRGLLEVVEKLAVVPTISINERNNNGQTALHCAAQGGNRNVVTCLISAGASKSVADNDGQWPRDLASDEAMQRLLRTDSFPGFINGFPDDWS